MMTPNRRNYYRILQIQPEAPPEVVKASWRALMHGARMHPDLGGDTQAAALINEAYAVLGDPVRRRAYDRMLDLTRTRSNARGPRSATDPRPATRRVDPTGWRTERCCPLCRAPLPPALRAEARCSRCDAPLSTPPAPGGTERELLGRRTAIRRARSDAAALVADWRGAGIDARLVDLSVGGASLVSSFQVTPGHAVRVITPSIDGVARVVACHRSGSYWRVRVQWLTVRPLESRGVYVRATA